MKTEDFIFLDPGRLVDGDLALVLVKEIPGNREKELLAAYDFEMRLVETGEKIGHMNIRIGNIDKIVRLSGHIGYDVDPGHRGHRYAARSCRLLFPLAKRHGMNTLWITCSPDNIASRITCERAGGKLVEIVDLPEENDMYKAGDRQKCRYRVDL